MSFTFGAKIFWEHSIVAKTLRSTFLLLFGGWKKTTSAGVWSLTQPPHITNMHYSVLYYHSLLHFVSDKCLNT